MHIKIAALVAVTLTLSACATDSGHQHWKRHATLPSDASPVTTVAGMPVTDLAAAQRLLSPDETLQPLNFPESGTTTVSGRIVGRQSVAYALPIRKDQRLEVTMETPSTSAYFNIQDVQDQSGAALFAGEMNDTRTALIRATSDTTYVLRPYLNRAVAREGNSANYLLKIERQ